jgi:hypothetical protein
MSYMISASRGPTAMASSAQSAVKAVEWIRSRRAVGADHFQVVDAQQHRVGEAELAYLAEREQR